MNHRDTETPRRPKREKKVGENSLSLLFFASVFSASLCLCGSFLPAFAADKPAAWQEVLPAPELGPLAGQVTAALKAPVAALVGGKLDDDDRERAVKKARGLALLMEAAAQATEGKGTGAER